MYKYTWGYTSSFVIDNFGGCTCYKNAIETKVTGIIFMFTHLSSKLNQMDGEA